MKNQTNRILVLFLIMGFVLLFSGCPADPSQNNQNRSNQNTANQNTSNDELTADELAPPPPCTSVSEQDIRDEIPRLPNPLKQQFDNGNITWSYDGPNHELIFKGYVYGNGVNLRSLLTRFNKFRGERCLWKVVFQGNPDTTNFEWRPDPNSPAPTPPNVCKKDVDDEIKNGILKSQLNHNLWFDFDESTKILTLTGYIGDKPQNGRFNAFIGQLQKFMRNGCISKIIFEPKQPATGRVLVNRGFGWQICEYPECERNGICVQCLVNDANTNSNTANSNTP